VDLDAFGIRRTRRNLYLLLVWSLASEKVHNGGRDVATDFSALSSSRRNTKTFVFLFLYCFGIGLGWAGVEMVGWATSWAFATCFGKHLSSLFFCFIFCILFPFEFQFELILFADVSIYFNYIKIYQILLNMIYIRRFYGV
jgi:hypothetical protein